MRTVAIFGVASSRSLGYHIANQFLQSGQHKVVVGCKDEGLLNKAQHELFPNVPRDKLKCVVCDVESDESMDKCFDELRNETLQAMIHAIAFAPTKALRLSRISDLDRNDFSRIMTTSAFSLPALTKRAIPLFHPETGGSIVALTFDGSQRVVSGYNAMAPAKAALETFARYLAAELGEGKIRVNCISAGPVNTPAARGLSDFHGMMKQVETDAALKRGVTHGEVANLVTFLCSDDAKAITGQTIRVDAGLSLRR